jgi:hypothetical protein
MSTSKWWHRRLGHVSIRRLKQFQNTNLLSGLLVSKVTNLKVCKKKLESKHHKTKEEG